MVLSDEEIKKRIVDDLYWDASIDASKVEVTVDNGWVTLNGMVPSYAARFRATDAACRILDVIEVDNYLMVRYPPEVAVPADADIKQSVLYNLAADPDMDTTDIRVSVRAGIVTMQGSVDQYWKKIEAEWIACRGRGVIDIVNELAVVPTRSIADRAIADDVRAALERNARVSVEDVTVEVEDGTVTLTGRVPNWSTRRAAVDAAAFTGGVVDVIDLLVIRQTVRVSP
ncbi:BON domain-containing protein [Methanocalculus sp.]|uniref:BON domain-containing protein n=1 Tax=Methanocalculus sp. TaxID=2004547 RepID=UPI00262A142A|nr:BON domain-containing protein [Methanocalculus sp.]MDG6249412.1 BON domain-containing protein [Methanocalculus sp.]